jgi:hypothetical protein
MSSIIPYVVSTLSESIVWDPTNLKKWLWYKSSTYSDPITQ